MCLDLWVCSIHLILMCVCCLPVAGFCSGETDLLGVSVDPCRWWRHRLRHTARQPQNQKVSFCTVFSLDQVATRYFVWLFFNPTSSEPSAEPLTSKITRLVYIFQLPSVVSPLKLFHIALKRTQAPSFFLKVTDTEVVVTDWKALRPYMSFWLKHAAQTCCQTYQCHWLFQSIAKPADWKYQSGVCSSWSTVSCGLNVDMLLPLPDNRASTENMNTCLKVGAHAHTYTHE